MNEIHAAGVGFMQLGPNLNIVLTEETWDNSSTIMNINKFLKKIPNGPSQT